MLLPDPMSKVLLVGTKDRLEETIELIYSLEAVHLIDFSPEEEGFVLGSPLPGANEASQKLIKLRSAEKDLDIEPRKVKDKISVKKIESELDQMISQVEADLSGVNRKEEREAKPAL